MPFRIVRNDITKMKTEAIVNTANPNPVIGDGSDANVYKAAGVSELLAARKELGKIERGQAVFTEGFGLTAKFIIHTAGPLWKGGNLGEEKILRSCYKNCLDIARELDCKSVAFPLISTGNYGYPKEKALSVALDEINVFLMRDDNDEMEVYLVIYDEEAFDLSSKIYSDIQSFIDANYIEENVQNEHMVFGARLKNLSVKSAKPLPVPEEELIEKSVPIQKTYKINATSVSLENFLGKKEESFQNILMHHIAERKYSNKEVYKRANIDAKLFSKIICTKNYVPKKKNVMALAVGLKLNLSDAEKFMAAAGYAFSNSEKFDLIVKYFISNENYNMIDLEEKLWELTGKTLGNLVE